MLGGENGWKSGGLAAAAFSISLLCHTITLAQTRVGPFEITGFYRYIVNPSTGHANPNNVGLEAKPGKPYLLLMEQSLALRVYGELDEHWSVFFEPRLYLDTTKAADNHYRQYESLPADFSGGDGVLLRTGGNDFKAEIWQAYTDYQRDNFWLRAGKQSIAWGEVIGVRVLDVVNPLDLSRFFLFDRAFEEFENIRIPQWFVRVNYTIPNDIVSDLTAELLLNPGAVVPTIFPQQGAPYNVVPGIARVEDDVNQGEPTVGMRLSGMISDLEFSLNFITKPDDNGVPVFKGLSSPPDPKLRFENRHPRVYIVGGSLNYVWEWAGALLRTETTVTPNAPFQSNAMASGIVERPVWKMVFVVDRPTYLIPGLDSALIGFQYFQAFTGGDLSEVRSSGAEVDRWVHQFVLALQQPLFRKRVSLEFVLAYDTDDSYWIQPGINWEVGNNIRLNVFYNDFGGAEKRPGRFGSFFWADGLFFRFTYGF